MTAMFRPTRSLSYTPALNTANELWSGSNTHIVAGRPSYLAAYGCETGPVPNGFGVRRTHRTLRVHTDHTDALGIVKDCFD